MYIYLYYIYNILLQNITKLSYITSIVFIFEEFLLIYHIISKGLFKSIKITSNRKKKV